MILDTKEEVVRRRADVVRLLSEEFDKWRALNSREELTLKMLAHLTICAAIEARGFSGAITFFHTQVSEMVWAALAAEKERQLGASGGTPAKEKR